MRLLLFILLLATLSCVGEPIVTERLSLRLLQPADWEVYLKINKNEKVLENANAKLSDEGFRKWFDFTLEGNANFIASQPTTGVGFVITKKESPAPIGYLMVYESEPGGFWEVTTIFEPGSWSQGYGTEARRAMMPFFFDTLKVPGLISTIAATNTPSLRLNEGLGFKLVNPDVRTDVRKEITRDTSISWREYRLSAEDYRHGLRRISGPCRNTHMAAGEKN